MAAPVLTTMTPTGGLPAGGVPVTITGTGFATASAVAFGATPATAFVVVSATSIVAVAPAGTGTVAVKVTNPDGTSASVPAGQFTYSSAALFTVAEARAFVARGTVPLADTVLYTTAVITAAEAEIRELFVNATGVDLFPTSYTEVIDGNVTSALHVARHNPAKEHPRRALTVSAASLDGVALTVTQLANVKAHADGRLVRVDGASWSSSTGYEDLAVSVTYTVGWATVPGPVHLAALQLAVHYLVGSDVPDGAVSFSDGGASYQFARPGQAPHWTGLDSVDAALLAYRENAVVVV
jgi:hypothetical protein